MSVDYRWVAQLRCGAHLSNLVAKKILKESCQNALGIVKKYVELGKIKRYVETRWNSVYDKLNELLMKNLVTADERQIISDSAELLRPSIDILSYAQGNAADWATFCQKYTSLKNGVTTPGIVANALAFYEKYTVY